MQILRMFLVVQLLVNCGTLTPAQTDVSSDAYRIHVAKFESHGETAIHALLRFGADARIPLGIVLTDERLCKATIDFAAEDQPAGSILDGLVKQINGYQWSAKDSVAVIEPSAMAPSTAQILSIILPRFAAPEGPIKAQQAYLWMFVKAIFKPSAGTIIHVVTSPQEHNFPAIDMGQVSLEHALNRLVSRNPVGAWVLFPVPDDISKATDHQFAKAVIYSDGLPSVLGISCSPPATQP